MKNSSRFLALAALVVLPLTAMRAQGTYTSSLTNGIVTSLAGNSALQTFTGFTNLTDVSWTVNNLDAGSQFAAFNLYYAQWNAGAGIISSTLTNFGSPYANFVGAGASNLTFTDSISLDPAQTYVLVLSNLSGGSFSAASGTIPGAPDSQFFGNGITGGIASVNKNDSTGGLVGALGTPTALASGYAYQMSVGGTFAGGGSPSPVPEPKTAAAGLAALFVAALVGRRMWQRRKVASEPLAA